MKNIAGKLFWTLVHTTTAVLILSMLQAYTTPQSTTLVAGASTTNAALSPEQIATIDISTTMGLVNKYRAENKLQTLTEDARLTQLASERAEDLVARQYYAHKNPDGKTFYDLMIERNKPPLAACENLSLSFSATVEAPFASWKASPSHNACMLDPRLNKAGYALREYGISYGQDGQPQTHYIVVAIHASAE